jgi:hypothetical protein
VRASLLDHLQRDNHVLDSRLEQAQEKGYPDEGDTQSRVVDMVSQVRRTKAS